MWQKEKKDSSIVSLALLLALAAPAVTLFAPDCVQAQSAADDPSLPLPQTVESGSTVRIDGSSSMTPINQSLKERFEKQFSGTKVEVAANGTDSALKALQDGKIDLAAINRGLTPEEKAQGLEQVRLRREKIAIIVGADNPFKGNLTNKQFARIFRGEITDWSELGGSAGKIRLIDRPQTSDTREAFRGYPVFKNASFATGSTATQLADDNTAEIIKQLGKDGISYVTANQISKLQGVRVLRLHKMLPDNPKYPFSQPFVYVYKKNPSLGTAGFLGFTNAKPGQQAIEEARTAEANAIAASVLQIIPPNSIASPTLPTVATSLGTESAEGATSPSAEATNLTTANQNNSPSDRTLVPTTDNIQNVADERISPWWWLLTLPVVGGLLWLLGKRRPKPQATDNVIESDSNQSLEDAVPTALGASVAPSVSEALSNNQLLRAYAQAQSGAGENTTQISSNLPQGVTNTAANVGEGTTSSVSNVTLGGSAALAGVTAVGLGTNIWSATSDREINIQAADETMEIRNNNVPQVISDVEAPVTEVTTHQQPDVPISTAEAQPPAQSNWRENVTSAGSTLAGGGSVLRSPLTGSSQPEAIAKTTQSDDLEEDLWDIETPATEVTIPKLQYFTTVDASATEVRDPLFAASNVEAPQAQIPIASDVNIEAPTTEITASVPEQPDVSIDVKTPTTEVRNSVSVASNVEASIIEVTSAEAQIPTVTSDVETPITEIIASFPEQPDVLTVTSDVETPTTEITASFPELASDEDDWDMEFAADQTEAQPPEPPAQFNWLEGITSAGGAVVAGSGAVLWSRLQSRGSQPEATNESTQINDADEDFWDIETPATESPDVPELASKEVTDSVFESPDVPELAFDQDDWDMEFAADQTEEKLPAQSNWLENITSAGGAVAGGGAVLWSRLSGKGSQPKASSDIIQNSDIDEDFWDIETPATEQPDVPQMALNAQLPTVEVIPVMRELPDVPQTALNAQLPTVEITPASEQLDIPQTALNAQLPTVEVIPAMPELPDLPQTALDVVADAAEEDLSAQLNWLENIISANDATLKDDTVSSGLFSLDETTSLNSPESDETSAVTDATLELPAEPIAQDMDETVSKVTDATLELPAEPIAQDMDETVSNVSEDTTQNVTEARPLDLVGGVPFIGVGAGAGAWSKIYETSENTAELVPEDTKSEEKDVESSIAIAPRTAKWAYVSWNVSSTQKEAVQQEGVCQLALRLYDVTNIGLSYQTPTLVQQYECEEITHDRYVAIPASDRDYMAEIGYVINGDRWFLLADSATIRVSSRPQPDFWFQVDAELIIHGSTEPGATVTIGGHSIKLKPDGTFHLRVPFTDSLIDYLMTAVTTDGQQTKTIHKKFSQETEE